MSAEAMTLVLRAAVPPLDKFVLVCLANYADERGATNTNVPCLVLDTGLGRQVVIEAIARLVHAGWLVDTRRRVAGNGVYRIAGVSPVKCFYTYRTTNPETGEFYIGKREFCGDPALDPYRGSGAWIKAMKAQGASLCKTILEVFETDAQARASESAHMKAHGDNPKCRNGGSPHALRAASLARIAQSAVRPASIYASRGGQ